MCDTFIILPKNGPVIFGKNSDREPNEAQSVEYHPPADHVPGAPLSCTYIAIPQVARTHGVLISRPVWMWGAEMGMNEFGVTIGNEAVFTRMPVQKKDALTGMDLLRLALERSKTAGEALEVIIQLLDTYGQGGNCGFSRKLYYHNSFIIADPGEAWILETAGSFWAAKQVHGTAAISNRLTIGSDYDRIHDGAEKFAKTKGWVKEEPFHFASAFSDGFFTYFSGSVTRLEEVKCRLPLDISIPFGAKDAMKILRSHRGNSLDIHSAWLMEDVCAHAANPITRHSAQSCNSFIGKLTPDDPMVWTTMTSAPCTSFYKPIWLNAVDEEITGPTPCREYDDGSIWWSHEALHRMILNDYSALIGKIQKEQQNYEQDWLAQAEQAHSHEMRISLTRNAIRKSREITQEYIRRYIKQKKCTPGLTYRLYWKFLNRQAKIPGL